MPSHYDLSDATFANQFATCTLAPQLFNHEAHLRLAWIHINEVGVDQAAARLCTQIQKFDATFDDGTNFNTTVTVAAVKAVNHFMQRSGTTRFTDFIQENPRLLTDFKALLATHYSYDIFSHPVAKRTYLQPDLATF